MDLMKGELRSYLDPTALRILKKRLVSGKITTQVFKDILKQQMVKHFFQAYRPPLFKLRGNWRGYTHKALGDNGDTMPQSGIDQPDIYKHKRF